MPVNFTPLDVERDILFKYGRGLVFYAVDEADLPIRWDGASPMRLAPLGATEGDINMTANGEMATLTLPELAGSAVFEAEYAGENPTLEIPLFLTSPDLLAICSPTGLASAGHTRVRPVAERTLVILLEAMFRKPDLNYGTTVGYTAAGGWTLDGVAFNSQQLALLSLSEWFWRGCFSRPNRRFLGGHGDAGKNIEVVTWQTMMHVDMPDAHRLRTTGDPADSGILIELQS